MKTIATFAFYFFLKFYTSKFREAILNINDNNFYLLFEIEAIIKHKVQKKFAKSLKYLYLELTTD